MRSVCKKAPVLGLAAAAMWLFSTGPAGASFWQGCLVTAQITTVGTVMDHPELGLHITKAETMGGSHAPCDEMVGKDIPAIVTKTPAGVTFERGQTITLDYTYYNAMTPNGVIDDIRWEFVSVE